MHQRARHILEQSLFQGSSEDANNSTTVALLSSMDSEFDDDSGHTVGRQSSINSIHSELEEIDEDDENETDAEHDDNEPNGKDFWSIIT